MDKMSNSLLLRRGFLRLSSSTLTQTRNGSRINIKRPRQPHFRRHIVFELTKPIYPRDTRLPSEKCAEHFDKVEAYHQSEKEIHPFEKLLIDMLRNDLQNHNSIAIYQRNCIKGYDYLVARTLFFKENLLLRHFEPRIIHEAIKGTKFEPLQCLFHTSCAIAMGNDPRKTVSTVLKLEKKIPEFILLGGVVENRILAKNQLKEYNELPELDDMRSQLVATLASPASTLSRLLQTEQSSLSRNLEQLIKQNETS